MIKGILSTILVCVCINVYADRDDNIFRDVESVLSNLSKKNSIAVYNKIINERNRMPQKEFYTFNDVKHSLGSSEIAMELFAHEREQETIYLALLVRSDYDMPHIYVLFTEKRLEGELRKGEKIYVDTVMANLFLSPIRDEIQNVTRILYTPAGELHHIALEYCAIEEGKMLGDKYEVYRLTSSAVICERKDVHTQPSSYAIFGGIDYDADFDDVEEKYSETHTKNYFGYLLDSYLAAKDINNHMFSMGLTGHLYCERDATEESFKSLSGQNIQLLLIETHGYIETEAHIHALLFAGANYVLDGGILPNGIEDGVLTSTEVSQLNLSTIDFAVISACKSALGDIDWAGVNGLMRGFKMAGVKSMVMTTDDVVDYVSGEVWKALFCHILQGKNKREALICALKEVRTLHEGFYNSPKYWTPFILIDGIL